MIDGNVGDPYIIVWAEGNTKLAKCVCDLIDKGYNPAGGPWTSIQNGHSGCWVYQAMWREPSREETDGRSL